MPKQDENPLQDYFKISNEDVSKAVCKLWKNYLSRGSFGLASAKFWLQHIPNGHIFR